MPASAGGAPSRQSKAMAVTAEREMVGRMMITSVFGGGTSVVQYFL